MEKIKIGVAGTGKMGQNHVRVLSELNGMFDLVGIYDPNPEKKTVAEKYGVKYYEDYEELLNDVQALTIACPTSLHKEMAIKAAEKGVHVLLEKPIAETKEDADAICEAFESRNLKLTVGFVERFNPVVKAISEIIKDMDVVSVEVHRCSPFDSRIYDVDVVTDLMIHDLDIVMNALGFGVPKKVSAIGKKVYNDKFVDYAQATLTYENALAFITTSRSTEDKIRTVCVHAKGAYIEGDLLNRTLTVKRGVNYYMNDNSDIKYKQSSITEQVVLQNLEPLKEEAKTFGMAVIENVVPKITGEQVLNTMEVLDKVEEAIYSEI